MRYSGLLAAVPVDHKVYAGAAFCLLACITLFYSGRRRLFLKMSSGSPILRGAAGKRLPPDPLFRRVLRGFAIAEFIIGGILLLMGFFFASG